jgi:rhodanese-related sulfurtransferase
LVLAVTGGFVVVFVALLVAVLANQRTSGLHLGPDEFIALAHQPGTVVIDVRTPAEFARGHLEGARNLDVGAADFLRRIADLDRTSTYAIYCCAGSRSAEVVTTMREMGFTEVVDLDGGITRWIREGREVVTL